MEMNQYEDPFSIPVPIASENTNAGGYFEIPIDSAKPGFSEPLVKIGQAGIAGEPYYHRNDGGNPPYGFRIDGSLPHLWCRQGVLEQLRRANILLRSFGVEIYVWDAYRTIETQKALWQFVENGVRNAERDMSDAEVFDEVIKYVSNPHRFSRKDPATWPVHATGGAVDLTLRSLDSEELLDMGAGFDDMRDISHTAAYEILLKSEKCQPDHEPLLNRRLLHWAMTKVGFANYPFEFWHFDWGTQMYVVNGQGTGGKAWYGYIDPPETD